MTTKPCPKCGGDTVQRYRDGKKSGWYCRPCSTKAVGEYYRRNPDKVQDSQLWTHYRIRLVDYRRMLDEQGGACKVCKRVPEGSQNGSPRGSGFVINHDHNCCPGTRKRWGAGGNGKRVCGKCIRGLLCQQCNVALAMVNDDPARLEALIAYLRAHRGSNPARRATSASPSVIASCT